MPLCKTFKGSLMPSLQAVVRSVRLVHVEDLATAAILKYGQYAADFVL